MEDFTLIRFQLHFRNIIYLLDLWITGIVISVKKILFNLKFNKNLKLCLKIIQIYNKLVLL